MSWFCSVIHLHLFLGCPVACSEKTECRKLPVLGSGKARQAAVIIPRSLLQQLEMQRAEPSKLQGKVVANACVAAANKLPRQMQCSFLPIG